MTNPADIARALSEYWMPIETARENNRVLGFVPCERRGDRIEIVRLRDGKPLVVGSEFAFDRAPVTHWMPLPEVPRPTASDASTDRTPATVDGCGKGIE